MMMMTIAIAMMMMMMVTMTVTMMMMMMIMIVDAPRIGSGEVSKCGVQDCKLREQLQRL